MGTCPEYHASHVCQLMIRGDNEMILGAVHRSPGIYFTAEENPGKSQLGDHLMQAV